MGSTSGDRTSALEPTSNELPISRVEYFGIGFNSCGYCKKNDQAKSQGRSRVSYDMRARKLTCSVYQDLLDRGWRRSGHYCYSPINHVTCCPNYTIRLDATKFKLTKTQRRCIKNLNNFLVNDNARYSCGIQYHLQNSEHLTKQVDFEILKTSSKARARRFVASCERKVRLYSIDINQAIEKTISNNQKRYKKSQDHLASLEELLFPINSRPLANKPKHKLEIQMKHVDLEASSDLRDVELALVRKYQHQIHREGPNEWSMKNYCDFLVNSPLIIEPFIDSRSSFPDIESSQYCLTRPPDSPNSYGSYHCRYILDGELIAVGVLDVLPRGITTVYFFYNPDYNHLNLGIYSALVEISMIRQMVEARHEDPEPNPFLYYYMGFYVHECKKMRYKVTFKPAVLLCSETLEYIDVETCLEKLKNTKYARFGDNRLPSIFECQPELTDILAIPVHVNNITSSKMIDYLIHVLKSFGDPGTNCFLHNVIGKYTSSIGSELSRRLLLDLNYIESCLARQFSPGRESSR